MGRVRKGIGAAATAAAADAGAAEEAAEAPEADAEAGEGPPAEEAAAAEGESAVSDGDKAPRKRGKKLHSLKSRFKNAGRRTAESVEVDKKDHAEQHHVHLSANFVVWHALLAEP